MGLTVREIRSLVRELETLRLKKPHRQAKRKAEIQEKLNDEGKMARELMQDWRLGRLSNYDALAPAVVLLKAIEYPSMFGLPELRESEIESARKVLFKFAERQTLARTL